jgi:hemerythrin superfamily protein
MRHVARVSRSKKGEVSSARKGHLEFARPKLVAGDDQTMDAIRALVAQHRAIEGLFEDASRRRRGRSNGVSRLAEELIAHLAAEDAVLYPSVRRALVHDGYEMDDEGRDECLPLRIELRRVIEADARDPSFDDRIAALKARFIQHVRDQEVELFPRVTREVSDAQREAIGAEILASRPPLWIVTTEGGALAHPGDEWAARSRLSLLLS